MDKTSSAQPAINRNSILIRALIILFFAGLVGAPAVFVTPLAKHTGMPVETISAAVTLMATFCTPGHLLGGQLIARFKPKVVFSLGAVLWFIAFAGTALLPSSAVGLRITFGACFGLACGCFYTPGTYIATSWFPDKRGLVSGLCMAVQGGSSAIIAPVCTKMIGGIGVRSTMIIVGCVWLVVGLVIAFSGMSMAPEGYTPAGYVPPKGGDETQLESWGPKRAFRTRAMWQITLCLAIMPVLYVVLLPRFTLFMTNAGIDPTIASLGVTVYAIANVVGRLGLGLLIDKTSYKFVYIWCGVFSIGAAVAMMSASTVGGFYLAYALLGIGFGSTNCVYPVAITKSFGTKYAGSLYGTGMLAYMVYGTLVTPAIVAALVASSGNYTSSFVYAIVLNIISVISMLLVPKVQRKPLAESSSQQSAPQA